MSKPGPKSKFSKDQEEHIAGLLPTVLVKYTTSSPSDMTKWKNEQIEEIMKSPLFSGQLPREGPTGTDDKGWKQRIRKKFNHHITTNATTKATPSSQSIVIPTVVGFDLFGIQQRAAIREVASAVAAQGKKRFLECVEDCHKTLWAALSTEQRAKYDQEAQNLTPNVATNQAVFPQAITTVMKNICQGGLFGNTELLLFWAHRETSGHLRYGSVNAHTSDSIPDMSTTVADWEKSFESKWMRYANSVISDSIGAPVDGSDVAIPRNYLGVPTFPTLTLKKCNSEVLHDILNRYLGEIWAHCHPERKSPPWLAIAADNSAFFDTSRFPLPVPLNSPELLTVVQVVTLAEHFLSTATVMADDPFVFKGIDVRSIANPSPSSRELVHSKPSDRDRTVTLSPDFTPPILDDSDLSDLDDSIAAVVPTHPNSSEGGGRSAQGVVGAPRGRGRPKSTDPVDCISARKGSGRCAPYPRNRNKQVKNSVGGSRSSRRGEPCPPPERVPCWMVDGYAYPEGGNPPPGHTWEEPHEVVWTAIKAGKALYD
ncbi:hypothetical protein R3P38DRAFT_3226547 [Favolaschia claudopus]|uniref:Uncharacterized protein n=1 Tax=Favolaschia claudopus TaxID=2862362 RepID=A0AAV9ZU39_9AGAR